MTRRRSKPAAASRGRAALALTASVLAVGLGSLWWWFATGETASGGSRRATPSTPAAAPEEPAELLGRTAAEANGAASMAPVEPPIAADAPARVGRLKVEVLDASGAALADMPVYLSRAGSTPLALATDFSGLADFAPLDVGDWLVRVGGSQHPLAPENSVAVAQGAVVSHRVQLTVALVELEVEVSDEAGRPAPNVALKARCERGGEPRATTDAAGRATLRHVQPGPVRVFASDEQLGRGNRIVEVELSTRASVQIALRRKP